MVLVGIITGQWQADQSLGYWMYTLHSRDIKAHSDLIMVKLHYSLWRILSLCSLGARLIPVVTLVESTSTSGVIPERHLAFGFHLVNLLRRSSDSPLTPTKHMQQQRSKGNSIPTLTSLTTLSALLWLQKLHYQRCRKRQEDHNFIFISQGEQAVAESYKNHLLTCRHCTFNRGNRYGALLCHFLQLLFCL